jgi:hypothetical protein
MQHLVIANKIRAHFNLIVFDEGAHSYTVRGRGLIPVSTLIKEFCRPFHAQSIASNLERKTGRPAESFIEEWDDIKNEACRLGTRAHDFGERYVIDKFKVPSTLTFKNVNEHLKAGEELSPKEKALIKFWEELPSYYIPILLELRMFNEEWGIAGTADIILLDTRDNTLVIADYKTNKDLFKQFLDQKLLSIFSDMNDTPYSHYKIQVSAYEAMIEETGYKVSRRTIIWLKEDGNYELFHMSSVAKEIKEYLIKKKEYSTW